MERLLQDVRRAVRQFSRRPTLGIVVIATFAIGIGPATAVLTFADRLALRPIAGVEAPQRLAMMQFGTATRGGYTPHRLSGPESAELLRDLPAISSIAGYQRSSAAVGAGMGPAEVHDVVYVGEDYFRVLALKPLLGRTISSVEAIPEAAMVAVISYQLWNRLFGRAPDVVGRSLRANGEIVTVIGVAPIGFHGPERLGKTDLWLPRASQGLVNHLPPARWSRLGFYEFILRLAPGAKLSAAKEQLRLAAARIAFMHPEDKDFEKMEAMVFPGIGVEPLLRETTTSTIRFLLAFASLLVVVACANAANLLLFRGAQQRHELSVRSAVGATRGRLVSAQLVESTLLAIAGGLVGTGVSLVIVSWLDGTSIWSLGTVDDLTLNWRVLGLTFLIAVCTGSIAGAFPAIALGEFSLVSYMKDSHLSGKGSLARSGLAAAQVAISLTLLVGSLLFTRSLENLRRVSLGFDPNQMSSAFVSLRGLGYSTDQKALYAKQLVQGLRSAPGVEEVSLSYTAPLVCCRLSARLLHSISEVEDTVSVFLNAVSPSYFRTLGIPMLMGRTFNQAEAESDQATTGAPVIISQGLASLLFGSTNPVGRIIRFDQPPQRLIIGVAGNVLWNDLTEAPLADLSVYSTTLPFSEMQPGTFLMVRSNLDNRRAREVIQDIAAGIDPLIPLVGQSTFSDVIDRHMAEESLFSNLLMVLAFIAVCLASLGVYALVGQAVAERMREFGIRTALGANQRDIMVLILRQVGSVVLIGIPAGLLVAAIFGSTVRTRLFGVTALEPIVYLLATIGILVVTIAAILKPTGTATRAVEFPGFSGQR